MKEPLEQQLEHAVRKAAVRLLPFLLLLYILAFLDRANVGFAKHALQSDTGLSEAAYAFGAGVFFAGYALLEVPSNLIMHRIGARIWLSRIMITWGLVAAAMMWAWTPGVFWTLRLLLGVAEAGFFPGVILYLTYWFPARDRGRMLGFFYFGAPLALILGGPISGALMELEGVFDLRGWQWMFLVEGLAASAVGVWAYWYIPNRPADAAWLSGAEKQALERALDDENGVKRAQHSRGVLATIIHPQVLHFALIYLLIQVSVYGVTFYLPSQVERLLGRKAGLEVGLVTAIPWLCALLALWTIPKFAARRKGPRWVGAATLLAAAVGIAGSSSSLPVLALGGLCLAAAGFIAAQPVFWTFPTDRLTGSAAAAAIALINSFGALGGFMAPNVRTWADHAFATAGAGVLVLASTTVTGALLFLIIPTQSAFSSDLRQGERKE